MQPEEKARLVGVHIDGDAVIDIVFVHGLMDHELEAGGNIDTRHWFETQWRMPYIAAQTFVFDDYRPDPPKDLGETISDSAVRLLAALDLHESYSEHHNEIKTFSGAENMYARSPRPLVFVCHCLGGLILKQALLFGEQRRPTHSLVQRTTAILFLGTPHVEEAYQWTAEGSPTASSLSSNESKKWSVERACHLTNAFDRIAPWYSTVNICHETLCPQSGNTHQSAIHQDCLWSILTQPCISLSEGRHLILPRHASSDLVKISVENSVRYIVDLALRRHQNYLAYLQNEEALKQTYAKQRCEGTGMWLLADVRFRTWADAEGLPLLWLHGSIGTGKSTLCSAIIDELRNIEPHRHLTIFCFIEEDRAQQDAAQHILKLFMYQLFIHQQPVLPELLLRSILRDAEDQPAPMPPETFRRLLRTILAETAKHLRLSFVIDGLNNSSQTMEIFLNEIIRANTLRTNVNAFRCMISTQASSASFVLGDNLTEIDLDSEHGVRQDLLQYATSRLGDVSPDLSERSSTPSLAKQLCNRASGMFLWVALALEHLQSDQGVSNLLDQIESMPSTIWEIYHQDIQAITNRNVEIAQFVFSWLIAANRPLSMSELLEALTVSPAPSFAKKPIEADLPHICGRLISIAHDCTVRLRHPTVCGFLISTSQPSLHRWSVVEAHELIAQTCLILLGSKEDRRASWLSTNLQISENTGGGSISNLRRYAVTNWSVHYRLAETHSKILAGTLQRCLHITLQYACDFFLIYNQQHSVQVASTALRVCAQNGFMSLTKMYLEMGNLPNGDVCKLCKTPLEIAANRGHIEVVKLLLQKGASVINNTHGGSEQALQLATSKGDSDVAKLVLRKGANVDAVNATSGRTALHVAATLGCLEIVRLLVSHGANLNAVTPIYEETPLHLAAMNGHLEVVKCLIDERGASKKEIELYQAIVKQPYYRSLTEALLTPGWGKDFLLWDADPTRSSTVYMAELQELSIRYTDIGLKTRDGRSALHLAAEGGHEAIVRFLLERRADVHLAGENRITALRTAAENGHIPIVRLLLEAGAGMDGRAEGLGLILENAERNGHHEVADLLVWYFFNVEVCAENCQWPMLSIATRSTHNVVKDALQKRRSLRKVTRSKPQFVSSQDRDTKVRSVTSASEDDTVGGLLASPTNTPISPMSPSTPIPNSETTHCSSCGATFTGTLQHRQSNLKRHMRTSRRHNGPTALKCLESGCKSTFMRTDNLAKHLQSQHGISRSSDRQDTIKSSNRVTNLELRSMWENSRTN